MRCARLRERVRLHICMYTCERAPATDATDHSKSPTETEIPIDREREGEWVDEALETIERKWFTQPKHRNGGGGGGGHGVGTASPAAAATPAEQFQNEFCVERIRWTIFPFSAFFLFSVALPLVSLFRHGHCAHCGVPAPSSCVQFSHFLSSIPAASFRIQILMLTLTHSLTQPRFSVHTVHESMLAALVLCVYCLPKRNIERQRSVPLMCENNADSTHREQRRTFMEQTAATGSSGSASEKGITMEHSQENTYFVFRASVTCAPTSARTLLATKGVKYICIHRRSASGSRKLVEYALTCVCVCAHSALALTCQARQSISQRLFSSFCFCCSCCFALLFFSVPHNSTPFVCRRFSLLFFHHSVFLIYYARLGKLELFVSFHFIC